MSKLTARQKRFVQEYLCDLNATQAAIRAGYSKKTAGSVGHENLSKPEIAEAIQAAKAERSIRTEITADRTLHEVTRLALADIRELFTESGKLRSIVSLGDDIAAAVQSVKVVTRQGAETDDEGNREIEYVHEIKLADKNSALEKLMKHLGQYEQDNRQKGLLEGLNRETLQLIQDKLRGRG
jgi:phage terminase small subunit